jgi:hypothetical protein
VKLKIYRPDEEEVTPVFRSDLPNHLITMSGFWRSRMFIANAQGVWDAATFKWFVDTIQAYEWMQLHTGRNPPQDSSLTDLPQ